MASKEGHFESVALAMTQVSDKERQLELDSLFKDVASVLSEKCINPDNSKPYTISMLERALKDVHFSVDLHRNAKQQALEVSLSVCVLLQKCVYACISHLHSAAPCQCKHPGFIAVSDVACGTAVSDVACILVDLVCLVQGHTKGG